MADVTYVLTEQYWSKLRSTTAKQEPDSAPAVSPRLPGLPGRWDMIRLA